MAVDLRVGPPQREERPTAPPPRSGEDRPPPRGRRTRSGTILLPPWTRAPWLGFRAPAVLLAVIGAAAILACASSSAALFLSSSSSKALQRLVAAQCPDSAFPTIRSSGTTQNPEATSQVRAEDHAVTTAMTGAGLPGPRVIMQTGGTLAGSRPIPHVIAMFYGTDALRHLPVIKAIPGARGLWISDLAEQQTGLRLGQVGTVNGSRQRVVGVYHDLTKTSVPGYWCSYRPLFFPKSVDSDESVPLLTVATDKPTWLSVARSQPAPTIDWLAPIPTGHVRLDQARTINAQENRAVARLSPAVAQAAAHRLALQPQAGAGNQNKLPAMTKRTELIRRGLHGPVVPIAVGGSILALLLVGAAGSYWADRRAREVRLLSSRGVGPGSLAAKAALELTAPAVIGTVLGWALALELIRTLGPSPDFERGAPLAAAGTAAIGLVAGVLLLSLVAGLRARNATERPMGHQPGSVASSPWELLILAAAGLLYLRLRDEHAVTLINGVAQVNLLLVAFPLLFLVGAAAFCVRVLALGLPALRRGSARWPMAAYFAIRRITGAPLVSVILLAAASMPVAVVVYSGAVTATSRTTVDAKASIYAGSKVSVATTYTPKETPALRRVGTSLTRYVGGTLGADDADVLAVDPKTFARWAFWDHRFSHRSLPDLMRAISAERSDGRVPAIVLRYSPGSSTRLDIGNSHRDLAVVATPKAFPGQRDPYSDLVVVDAARLGSIDHYVDHQGEVWSARGQSAVERTTTAQGLITQFVATPHSVVDATNYLAVSWTFGYLEALAALVGLIAIGGLLLYLATRQRSRTASYAMGRRMGLTRRRHLRSLIIELSALLGTAYVLGAALAWVTVTVVYRRLDVDPVHRPAPLLTIPVAAFVGSAVVVVVVALLAALSAQRAADAANPSEVMRLDA